MSGGGKKGVPDIPTEQTFLVDPISHYRSRTGAYPSNSQMWWAYRRPIEIGTDSPPKTYLEVFDPSLRHQINTGNSPAPKGHFILKALHQDRSGVSGVAGIPVVSSNGLRPSCVAFYAGRVFYSGVNTSGFNTKIYFSQVLERLSQVAECYQQLDPTAEDLRDLLPTDGGVIVIPEVSEIYNMVPMGQSLFVFARNGVWQISGSEGIGFRANDYSVSKVSGVPTISSMSFVLVEGAPIWWNRQGIYTLVLDQIGNATVKSLTEDTIQSFFDEIPEESKFWAKGAYDPRIGRVQWIYRQAETVGEFDQFRYDRILNLDTRTGAFYPWKFEEAIRVELLGIFDVEGFSTEQSVEDVDSDNDRVRVGSDDVQVNIEFHRPVSSKIKYVVNILDEAIDIPEPPEPVVPDSQQAFVDEDPVVVNSDDVYVSFV